MGGLAARLLAGQAQEEYCLCLLLERPETWSEMQAILTESDFANTETRELFRAFAAAMRTDMAFDVERFVADLPPVLRVTAEHVRARGAQGIPEEGTGLTKAASHAAYRLKRLRLGEEMAELDYLERDAEQTGDADTLRALLGRKQQLLFQRRTIDTAASLFG